jgi:hypothetical protein
MYSSHLLLSLLDKALEVNFKFEHCFMCLCAFLRAQGIASSRLDNAKEMPEHAEILVTEFVIPYQIPQKGIIVSVVDIVAVYGRVSAERFGNFWLDCECGLHYCPKKC